MNVDPSRAMDHFAYLTSAHMKAYAHYHNDNFKPRGFYVRSPDQTLPKPFEKDQKSVYKADYHDKLSNSVENAWYSPKYNWPYLVDTRRTLDPDFEVTKQEKNRICENFSPKEEGNPVTLRTFGKKAQLNLNEVFRKADYDQPSQRDSYSRRFQQPSHIRSKTFDKVQASPLEQLRAISKRDQRDQEADREGSYARPRLSRSHSVSEVGHESAHKPSSYAEIHLRRLQHQSPVAATPQRRSSEVDIQPYEEKARPAPPQKTPTPKA